MMIEKELEELKWVRDTGLTNMLDRRMVLEIANLADLTHLVSWLNTHTVGEYAEVIINGVTTH